jgi:hypothetical protein
MSAFIFIASYQVKPGDLDEARPRLRAGFTRDMTEEAVR